MTAIALQYWINFTKLTESHESDPSEIKESLFRPIENILYGIVLVIVYTVVLDKMLLWGNSRIELMIVSNRYRQISDAILTKVDRGVTMLSNEGGFLFAMNTFLSSTNSHFRLHTLYLQKLPRTDNPGQLNYLPYSHANDIQIK